MAGMISIEDVELLCQIGVELEIEESSQVGEIMLLAPLFGHDRSPHEESP